MKNTFWILTCLLCNQLTHGQAFTEICESTPANGTIVDCQLFNGTLYSTGFFSTICGEAADYMAQWENDEWQASAIGLSDPGHALTVIDNELYIAKYEESIDSNWVYVYDNSSLEKLGEGVYLTTASGFSELPNIYDIVEYDGKIVACGEFDRVGEESIQGIMEWDGSSWNALGTGLAGNIPNTAPVMFPHQMMVYNGELYVVGNFSTAGSQMVNGIAKWDGSAWSNMGAGFDNTVYSITVLNDEIIVGGSFTESDGTILNRIAKWNGSSWQAMDFGFSQPSVNDFIFVHTLKVIDGVLYIGGGLKELIYPNSSTELCNGIVSYSNGAINTFMGGVPNFDIEAIALTEDNQLLIGGGVFGSGYSGIALFNTHLHEQHSSDEVLVFPCPVTDFISINTTNEYSRYELINNMGQLVQRGKFEKVLSLNVPTGFYYLKLVNEENSYSIQKIVKE